MRLLSSTLVAFLLAASGLVLLADTTLPAPQFDAYKPASRGSCIGMLGLPLGTFAVVEGNVHATGKQEGSDDFYIVNINGKKLWRTVKIQTEWPSALAEKKIVGKRYVLHGYERGKWQGQPDGLPDDESGRTQGGGFVFSHIFVVTSVEKVDGVTLTDAKKLDPKVPLNDAHISDKTDDVRPVGVLGLPLGTYAVIEVHSPKDPTMMASPFEIEKVNGVALDKPRVITISGAPATKEGEHLTLHGYEAGEWASTPDLPKSENPSGQMAQQIFGFFPEFIVTTPVKPAE